MRKFEAILLVLLLVLSVLVTSAFAADAAPITGNTVEGAKAGDVVEVTFTVPEKQYICNFNGTVVYDETLLQPQQTEGLWVSSDVFTDGIFANPVAGEGLKFAGAKAGIGYEAGGVLLRLRFEVLKDLPAAGTQVSVRFAVLQKAPSEEVTEDMTVSLTAAAVKPVQAVIPVPTAPTETTYPTTVPSGGDVTVPEGGSGAWPVIVAAAVLVGGVLSFFLLRKKK